MVSLANGGGNELENLRTLCRGCHIEIHRQGQAPRDSVNAWDEMVKELSSV